MLVWTANNWKMASLENQKVGRNWLTLQGLRSSQLLSIVDSFCAVQYPALVWPVETLVRCGGVEFDGHVGGRFVLAHSMHRRIMDHGVFE
jgi:hypothetical protein